MVLTQVKAAGLVQDVAKLKPLRNNRAAHGKLNKFYLLGVEIGGRHTVAAQGTGRVVFYEPVARTTGHDGRERA